VYDPSRPLVAPSFPSAGRIRLALDHVPAAIAVPPNLAEQGHGAFSIVDVTPNGQELFALGVCPASQEERGELAALASDQDGRLHVVCIARLSLDEAFEAREGTVGPSGGLIDWKPVVVLPAQHAARIRVRSLEVKRVSPSMLSYELQRVGPKSYQTFAAANVPLTHDAAATPIDLTDDRAQDQGAPLRAAWPSDLALSIGVDVATVRRHDEVLARWQLPASSPEQALATCDAAGCVGVYVFESAGNASVHVLRRRRG
jgi:hypothetical protein